MTASAAVEGEERRGKFPRLCRFPVLPLDPLVVLVVFFSSSSSWEQARHRRKQIK
jgi:hypothetical protein